jgi:mannose-6-phosphate isomerase-like protein (cupin superfamily)|tara:strand:+ start:309 stop:839 length:531 start_codon:yes stop_codon:yes gene_type:complete
MFKFVYLLITKPNITIRRKIMGFNSPLKVSVAFVAALTSLALFSFNSHSQSSEPSVALAVNLSELEWGPAGGGNGFPVGVRTARQGIDKATGGITYYALFPAGSHFEKHWHSHDEYVVVVSGKLEILLGDDTHKLAVGSYIVIPGSLGHAWTVPEGGDDAVILVRRAGPADFHFVE